MTDDRKELPADPRHQFPAQDTDGEPDFIIESHLLLIPDGEYVMTFLHSETVQTPWGPKVAIWLEVFEGPQRGVRLPRYYNVASIAMPPKRGGSFIAKGPKSDLYREWVAVCGPPAKGARLSFRAFQRMLITCEVRTVKTDGKGNSLPPGTQYSEIARLISGSNADQ